MEIQTEDYFIQKCRSQIETQLGWGSSDLWTNQDFETLSEKIQEATGIYISITTLKRIWGKVKYESKPTVTTLNTLAQFLNFNNWRAFIQSQSRNHENGHSVIIENQEAGAVPEKVIPWKFPLKKTTRTLLLGIALCAFIVVALFYFFSADNYSSAKINPAQFEFSSKKIVSSGVPNSVVFDYNASAAAPSDSIYIQQSWDSRLSQQVSRNEYQHTSIYYYPGFFQAKLIVNKQVVKEHNLLIQTNGWLPLVEQTPIPVYFKEADAKQNNMMSLSMDKLKANNISLQPVTPWVDYYNVRDFGDLKTDNFTFETEVKNDYKEGAAICQNTEITLLTEGSAITIPLSIKGCVSDLKLFFIDHTIDGKKDDLSAFGCDLSNWVKVRCEVKDKAGKIFINDQLAYETNFESLPTKITGIVYRFQGGGSVNSVKLSKPDGEIVYQDDF